MYVYIYIYIYIYIYAGAFGQVFLAEDMTLGGHVAIKVQGAGSRQALVAQVRELEEEWEDESLELKQRAYPALIKALLSQYEFALT